VLIVSDVTRFEGRAASSSPGKIRAEAECHQSVYLKSIGDSPRNTGSASSDDGLRYFLRFDFGNLSNVKDGDVIAIPGCSEVSIDLQINPPCQHE
jgi:hypothetical protein